MNRITALAATAALAAGSLALTAPTQAAPAQGPGLQGHRQGQQDGRHRQGGHRQGQGPGDPKAAGQKVVLQQRVGNKKSWKSTGQRQDQGERHLRPQGQALDPGPARVPRPQAGARRASRRATARPLGRRGLQVGEARLPAPAARRVNVEPAGVTDRHRVLRPEPGDHDLGDARRRSSTRSVASAPTLRATYALTDSSATGSSGAVTVTADGAVLANHSLRSARSSPTRSLDVSDVFRLKVDLATTAPRRPPSPPSRRPRCSARADAHPIRSGGHDRNHRPGSARRCCSSRCFRHPSRVSRSVAPCGRHRLRRRDQAAPGDHEDRRSGPQPRPDARGDRRPRASRSPPPTCGTTSAAPPASPAASPPCRARWTASPASRPASRTSP